MKSKDRFNIAALTTVILVVSGTLGIWRHSSGLPADQVAESRARSLKWKSGLDVDGIHLGDARTLVFQKFGLPLVQDRIVKLGDSTECIFMKTGDTADFVAGRQLNFEGRPCHTLDEARLILGKPDTPPSGCVDELIFQLGDINVQLIARQTKIFQVSLAFRATCKFHYET